MAAILALAPQLAFRVKPDVPTLPNPDWADAPMEEIRCVEFTRRFDPDTGAVTEEIFSSWVAMPGEHMDLPERDSKCYTRYEFSDGKWQRI